MVEYVDVKLWGVSVGAAYWEQKTKSASFEYYPNFIKKGLEVSPISMPLSSNIYSFPELNFKTFKGLPGLLADSLPDKFGNDLINRWLAMQGRESDSYSPIERLLYLGKRSMGALEFEKAEKIGFNRTSTIEIDSLVKAASIALDGKNKLNTNLNDEEKALLEIIKVGTSAGGARAKAVIAFNDTTKEVRSGQLVAPKGFEHWLLKLDGVTNTVLGDPQHFGRIEYAYYKMAIQCGIEMTECRLLEENNRAHFMTKRFDRVGEKEKIHMQTLCGLAHYDFNIPGAYSYEQLFMIMRQLRLPYKDAEQVYRRMVFNIVARNQDDHTKNFSFLMDKEGIWRLAPAYDIAYSYNPSGEYTFRHQMSVNGKTENFIKQDLLAVASSMHIKKPETIIEEIIDSVANWSKQAADVNIPSSIIESISKTHLLNLRNLH
jgi:Uncharacterized protein related to capsule biosynthesis enzymes